MTGMGTNTPVPSPAVLKNRGVPVSVHALVPETGSPTEPPERVTNDIGEFVYETAYIKLDNNALADIEDATVGFGSLLDWQVALDVQPVLSLRRTLAIIWHRDPNNRGDLLWTGARMIEQEQDQYTTAIAIAFLLANGQDPTRASQLLVKEAALRVNTRQNAVREIEKSWLATEKDKQEGNESGDDQNENQNQKEIEDILGISGSTSGSEQDVTTTSSGD